MERGNGVECGKFLYRIKKTTQGLYLRNLFWFLIVNHTSIIAVGGINQNDEIFNVEHISTANDTCNVVGMGKTIYGNPMVFTTPISEDLLVCGGNNNFRKCKILAGRRNDDYGQWRNFKFNASTISKFNSSPRIMSCAATTRHASFIFGGKMGKNITSYEYMLISEKIWRRGKMLIPDGFENGCAVTISDDEIWLIGGKGAKQSKRVLAFYPGNHTFNETGIKLTNERHAHRCSLMPDKSGIMVTGGTSSSTEIIDFKTKKSEPAGFMNVIRSLHGIGTLIIDDTPTLVVFGGYGWGTRPVGNTTEEYREYFKSFEKYDAKARRWSVWNGAYLKTARREFGFATIKPSMICKNDKN